MAESILLYVATADGLFILNKPGTSKEWLPPRHALTGQPVAAAQATFGPPTRLVVRLAGDAPAYLLSLTNGRVWEPVDDPGDLPTTILPSRSAPLTLSAMKRDLPPVLLAVEEGTLHHSLDDGATWAAADTAPAGLTALTPDPLRRERLYAGTGAGLIHTSPDRGARWEPLAVAPLPPIAGLFVLRIG